jgi:excisionase family DNA binding protein
MRSERQGKVVEKLLNVDEAAVVLGTSSRFPRRLIAERRIRFVRIGRHVRIPASALEEYVNSRTVQPVTLSCGAA